MLFLNKEKRYQVARYSLMKIAEETGVDMPLGLEVDLAVIAEVGPYTTKEDEILNLCRWNPTEVFKTVAKELMDYIPTHMFADEVAKTILIGVKKNYPQEDYLDETDITEFVLRSKKWIEKLMKKQK